MKFLNSFFLICSTVLVLSACTDKKQDPDALPAPQNATTKCQPESLTEFNNYNNQLTRTDSSSYIYNTANKLIQRSFFDGYTGNFNSAVRYTYDANGRLYQQLDNAGRLNEMRQYDASGLLNKITGHTYLSNGDTASGESVLVYKPASILKKINFYRLDKGQKVLTNFVTFTMNADRLISNDSSFMIGSNGSINFFNTSEFLYDDKQGLSEFGIEPSNIHEYISFYSQKHNVITERKTDAYGNTHTVNFQYTYNALGYPEKVSIINGGLLQTVYKIKYFCF